MSHRDARDEHERSSLVLKVVAIVVLSGIGIGFLLLAATSGGGGDDVAVTNPAVPTIADDGGSESDSETANTPANSPAPPPATLAAPAVGTQTTMMAPKPKPTPTARPDRPGRDGRTARVDRPCKQEGAFAFTKRLEPLVCRNGRWELLI